MTILVTGGAGFIGSNFVLDWLAGSAERIVNLDKLTYAGNLENLASLAGDERHDFVVGGIEDEALVYDLLCRNAVRAVVNFAAESHVDRSIVNPGTFIDTNVVGTYRLLEAARRYWQALPRDDQESFRLLHVSTDEVYGTLSPNDPPFTEAHPYKPNSPYAASKASSDHLVRSYHETYGLPVLITNCSNNYGPYHFPEKLIPLVVHNALAGEKLPLYGDGQQVRDWLYVSDHCSALRMVLERAEPGTVYNVGGGNERTNLQTVEAICAILDALRPLSSRTSYAKQITFVKDRLGHDRRYAIDASKIMSEIGWRPAETFETGLDKTVRWYMDNPGWVERSTSGAYRDWIDKRYA